tara:strand:+ start:395 stop:604 length:210 start_codon:yes stop_codon:yes gene_type:complete
MSSRTEEPEAGTLDLAYFELSKAIRGIQAVDPEAYSEMPELWDTWRRAEIDCLLSVWSALRKYEDKNET